MALNKFMCYSIWCKVSKMAKDICPWHFYVTFPKIMRMSTLHQYLTILSLSFVILGPGCYHGYNMVLKVHIHVEWLIKEI